MAKFAQYYLKYKLDDLFAQETKVDRQKFFGALFEKDESIEFAVGEGEDRKVFKHKVYHLSLNKDINTKIGFPQSANITPPPSLPFEVDFLYYFPKSNLESVVYKRNTIKRVLKRGRILVNWNLLCNFATEKESIKQWKKRW